MSGYAEEESSNC